METLINPLKAQIQTLTSQAVDAQKQVTDWQLGQLKLMEKQMISSIELSRAGVEATVSAANAMGKTWLDAMAPVEAAKSN